MKKEIKTEFPITTVCKEDVDTAGFDTTNITEEQLKKIANNMEDMYLKDGFWHDLRVSAEKVGIPKKKKKSL